VSPNACSPFCSSVVFVATSTRISPALHRPFQASPEPVNTGCQIRLRVWILLPSELMPPPALEVSLDRQPPSTCLQASWPLLCRIQEPTCDASRAALVVPHHHSRLGFATPPGMLQPDLGSEVHSVLVVPTGSTVARVHSTLRLPDIRATEVTGTRWDTDGTSRCVPNPSKTFLLVDSSTASRRCLPPCRSPSEWACWPSMPPGRQHVTSLHHPGSNRRITRFTCQHRRLTMNTMLHAHQP
jgi:hypothetical protein